MRVTFSEADGITDYEDALNNALSNLIKDSPSGVDLGAVMVDEDARISALEESWNQTHQPDEVPDEQPDIEEEEAELGDRPPQATAPEAETELRQKKNRPSRRLKV